MTTPTPVNPFSGIAGIGFVKAEATLDTPVIFATTDAIKYESYTLTPSIGYTKRNERSGSQSHQGFVQGRRSGTGQIVLLLKTNAVGTVPPEDVLVAAGFAADSVVTPSTSVVYNLGSANDAPPSFQIGFGYGTQFFEQANGCVVTNIKWDLPNDGNPCKVTVDFEFATYSNIRKGATVSGSHPSGTSITLATDGGKSMLANARIKFVRNQVDTITVDTAVGSSTTYTFTVAGVSISFTSASSTKSVIRDGLLAAAQAKTQLASTVTFASQSTDQITITATRKGVAFTTAESDGNLSLANTTTAAESNSTTGYRVTAIASDVLTITPTLAAALAGSEEVVPMCPDPTYTGTPVTSQLCGFTWAGSSLGLMTASINFKTGNTLLNRESTSDRPNRGSKGEREITAELTVCALEAHGPLLNEQWQGTARAATIRLGPSTAGKSWSFSLPAAFATGSMTKPEGAEAATGPVNLTATQSAAANDEMVVTLA